MWRHTLRPVSAGSYTRTPLAPLLVATALRTCVPLNLKLQCAPTTISTTAFGPRFYTSSSDSGGGNKFISTGRTDTDNTYAITSPGGKSGKEDQEGIKWVPTFSAAGTVELSTSDVVFQYVAGSGPGGQKINKTKNCVQVLHVPTGIRAESQMTRVLHLNRGEALRILQLKVEEAVLGPESRLAIKRAKEHRKTQSQVSKSHRKLREIDELEAQLKRDDNTKNHTGSDERQGSLEESASDDDFVKKYDPENPLASLATTDPNEAYRREAKRLLRQSKLEKRDAKREVRRREQETQRRRREEKRAKYDHLRKPGE